IAAAGAWYWQAPEPLAWYKDTETPGLWRHGLGLSFALYRHYFHLGLPQLPHAMTAPAATIALGLRDYLLSQGATFGPPSEVNWESSHPSWRFGFDEANRPKFRLSEIPPAAISHPGWLELAPGLWVHGDSGTCFWSRCTNTHTGGPPIGTYVLTWPLGAAAAAQPLLDRLSQTGMYQAEPERLPPDHDGVEFHWHPLNAAAPEILPR
ncbi:MAG TPA: hypothetical protein VNT01_07835, partial [Symbiobacteriaceae bacterium]|nr:hypothetical protein [Symbiobacteriaceae bacterium]